jgi:16S rRNA (cytidine1402-2'-O)-methyltransferase
MTLKGKLFMVPNIIADETHDMIINAQTRQHLTHINYFLAEDVRTARRYLSRLKIYPSIEALTFSVLDKNTEKKELKDLFKPIFEGQNVGVISESGCPGIADPGALAAHFAHENGIQIVPLVGPSSIIMALMASGLNGQRFAFNGYLPIESKDLVKTLKDFEKESKVKDQTQIFIETPYRNQALFGNILKTLHADTQLCIALDITGASEFIATKSIKNWRTQTIELPKQPAVFLFLA